MRPSPDDLERSVHQLLRSLPERSAPASLEARVLTRIRPRETSVWTRRSYGTWPAPLRLAFLAGSAAAAAIVVVACSRLSAVAPLSGAASAGSELLATAQAFVADLQAVAAALLHHIPSAWIYGLLGLIAVSYAVLVGIGSVLYRTLATRPSLSP